MKPLEDKYLKRYLIKAIKEYWSDPDIEGTADKILRHLNSVGYVKVEVDRPKVADEFPPTDILEKTALTNWEHEHAFFKEE